MERESLRIATWNIWFPGPDRDARLSVLGSQLAAASPDVVCLQECWPGAASALAEAAGMAVAVTGVPDAATGSGNAILTRLPVDGGDACAHIVLDGWDQQGARRGAVATRVVSRSGRRWRVTCTHLAWGESSEALRRDQLRYLDEMAAAEQARLPLLAQVLCGDFNCVPASSAYRYVTGLEPHPDGSSTTWLDAWAVSGAGDGWTSDPANPRTHQTAASVGILDPGMLPRRRIDYVLARGWSYGRPGCPVSAELVGTGPGCASDHYGVVADLWDPTL